MAVGSNDGSMLVRLAGTLPVALMLYALTYKAASTKSPTLKKAAGMAAVNSH